MNIVDMESKNIAELEVRSRVPLCPSISQHAAQTSHSIHRSNQEAKRVSRFKRVQQPHSPTRGASSTVKGAHKNAAKKIWEFEARPDHKRAERLSAGGSTVATTRESESFDRDEETRRSRYAFSSSSSALASFRRCRSPR